MVVTMTADGQSEVVTEYTYSPSGALTTEDDTITVSYLGMTADVSITVEASSSQDGFTIVNGSADDVEIYYEVDKEEYGNTTVQAGATVRIYPETSGTDGYYIRYLSGGSTNTHNFEGIYGGNEFDGTVNYYDGNICPPNEDTLTQWDFLEGDGGTLTISSASRSVTYDGENEVGYGENAENPIQY